MGKGAE